MTTITPHRSVRRLRTTTVAPKYITTSADVDQYHANLIERMRRWGLYVVKEPRPHLTEKQVQREVTALLPQFDPEGDARAYVESVMRFSGGNPAAHLIEHGQLGLLGLPLDTFALYVPNGFARDPFDPRSNLAAGMRAHANGVLLEVERYGFTSNNW